MVKKFTPPTFTEEEIEEDFKSFERFMRMLISEYNMFLAGSRKNLPDITEGHIRKIMKKYQSGELLKSQTDRYRLYNLIARFNSFREMFGRRIRNKEQATLAQNALELGKEARAKRLHEEDLKLKDDYDRTHRFKFTAVAKNPNSEEHIMTQFYQQFKSAHKLTGQNRDSLSFDKFKSFISKQTETVKAKKGCSAVKFTLSVEHGEVKLVAKPAGS